MNVIKYAGQHLYLGPDVKPVVNHCAVCSTLLWSPQLMLYCDGGLSSLATVYRVLLFLFYFKGQSGLIICCLERFRRVRCWNTLEYICMIKIKSRFAEQSCVPTNQK